MSSRSPELVINSVTSGPQPWISATMAVLEVMAIARLSLLVYCRRISAKGREKSWSGAPAPASIRSRR